MGELLIKPYEISVWEDKLTPIAGTNPVEYRFEENKLAVIGSDKMTGLNKVYDPVFNKKTNGEKTLSFSLRYKYFDPYSGNSDYVNPFAALLVNERKVKLHYDNQWYEFIVKDHTESSDGLEWTYTCSDAFVLELSKNGYNITFDSELNNNQGTARELAEKTLKDTDWKLRGVTVGKQMVAEPIYKATLLSTTGITITNTDNTDETVAPGTAIYLFYTYVKNQDGKFVQFIIRNDERPYLIDDNNVITDTNFRTETELTYKSDGFYKGGTKIISWTTIENKFQANRLVYGQLTTYDPVMKRTVDRFKSSNGDLEVYRYTDYTYTTSNVITNFITNGDNFNILEDGTLQGWNPYVDFTSNPQIENDNIEPLELVTKPELATGVSLADLSTLSQIEGFLQVTFKGSLTTNNGHYENAIYNSGLTDSASFINSISKGDEFIFRWRAGQGDINHLTGVTKLGLIVAKYTQDKPGWGYYYKHFTPNDIIIQTNDTDDTAVQLNNYIEGGTIKSSYELTTDTKINSIKTYYTRGGEGTEQSPYVYTQVNNPVVSQLKNYYERHQSYVIDDVSQTPSTKYIYKVGNASYTWNALTGQFDSGTSNYLPYYYLKATAKKSISNAVLTDPTERIGIFIYSTDTSAGEKVNYIQDIQFTRFVADEKGKPLLIGNVPTATSTPTEYYYIKPLESANAEDVITYASTDELLNDLYSEEQDHSGITIEPLYNTQSEKNLSISASQSNCFNILQTIAETFECWIDLVVEHDTNGAIRKINGEPQKFVYLREYAGKDNDAGFKYGINLNSIERTVNSDEIVTKLIVEQSQSDYTDEGFVSIANAPSNISGESYILNFDYYYNQGLLNRTEVEAKKNEFVSNVAQINQQLQLKEKERRELEASRVALESKRNVFTELVETAKDNLTRALADFERLTGQSYEDYRNTHDSLDDDEQLTEEETVFNTLGEIYTCSTTINNYSGLLTNIEQEYWKVREKLRGTENYSVKIWVGQDDNKKDHIYVELNDYLVGFKFKIDNSNNYEVTVSKKYFDILINTGTAQGKVIQFTPPTGYRINFNTYSVNKNKTQTFRIIVNGSSIGIEDEIDDLQEQKDNLTNEFHNIYRRFIQEGTWSSTDYIDSERYYLDALQVSNTSAQPTVSYTINVVEISELEDYKWYNFDAGDKTYIEDTEFFGWASVDGNLTPAREEVIVSEVEWHLDNPENNVITVQNYKTRFEDLFQRISATVQTVQYNEATYAKISTLLDTNGTINQNVLLDSLNKLGGQNYNLTSDGSVMINGDQILVQNLTNLANRVILNSEGLRISSDGGQTWKTAIDGQGINIGAVYTGTLNTQNVVIGSSDNPSFRWDKSGISAYKSNEETGIYDLRTYVRYDEFGLYGIKNGAGFKANTLQDVLNNAHFAVTWDGFFIRNDYTGGGRVEITSDNDFRVLNTVDNKENEKIKIGALEWMVRANVEEFASDKTYYIVDEGKYVEVENPVASDINSYFEKKFTPQEGVEPSLYGIRIKNNAGKDVMKTDDDGNLILTGAIEALEGNFSKLITVGKNDETVENWIEIDGVHSLIKSSDYYDGAGLGWMINKDGDAVFNNITARGAIKTAVFEYAEIQAVGGVFLFRPSSTIKSARIGNTLLGESNEDLIVEVEKPFLFANIKYNEIRNPLEGQIPVNEGWYVRNKYGYQKTTDDRLVPNTTYYEQIVICHSWCKVSNYTEHGSEPNISNILLNNGLTHVYEVSNVDFQTKEVTLRQAASMVNGDSAVTTLEELAGGALIDMGREEPVPGEPDNGYENGIHNYGIGVNSSDNTVNLPARSITLFETVINSHAPNNIRVTYDIKSVLGTLPVLTDAKVHSLYHDMEGTQGIYTDNMYIGDNKQYIAFYKGLDNNKHLKINTEGLTLKAGTQNSSGFIYLSNEDYGSIVNIGDYDLTGKIDWRLLLGDRFGIDSAGNLFASNAFIQGTIVATAGSFGGAAINNGKLEVPETNVLGLTDRLNNIANSASNKGYTLYVQTVSETETSITLKAYVYYGNTDITQTIGEGLFLWYKKSETSNVNVLYREHVKEITFDKTTAGYGTSVICSLALDDDVLLTTPDYYAVTTPDNYVLEAHV